MLRTDYPCCGKKKNHFVSKSWSIRQLDKHAEKSTNLVYTKKLLLSGLCGLSGRRTSSGYGRRWRRGDSQEPVGYNLLPLLLLSIAAVLVAGGGAGGRAAEAAAVAAARGCCLGETMLFN